MENSLSTEPPILPEDAKYYNPDSYYTDTIAPNSPFEQKVVPFAERKKISYPSRTGLYVAEILLLQYCSYGSYPHPKTGYPGFWWFEYGIRNVDAYLRSLAERGYIEFNSAAECLPKMTIPQLKELAEKHGIEVKGKKADILSTVISSLPADVLAAEITERKYKLTEKGKTELQENQYVPYMHTVPGKTTEDTKYGPMFNVWAVNRKLGEQHRTDWENVVSELRFDQEQDKQQKAEAHENFLRSQEDSHPEWVAKIRARDEEIEARNAQIARFQRAEKNYEITGNIDVLIHFWEDVWDNGGLLVNGSHWTFRIVELYFQVGRYDDALAFLDRITDDTYSDRKERFIQKINKEKQKKR